MHLYDFHSALDLQLYQLLNRDGGPALDAVMRALSSRAFGIGAGIVFALLLALRSRRITAYPILAIALALFVSDFIGSQFLRPLFSRMRPCYALPPGTFRLLIPIANGPSLPSLHTSNAFALAWVTLCALPHLAPLAYAFATAIALSRIYVGVHWPTDVFAGILWGSLAGTIGWRAARITARRPLPPGQEPRGPEHPAP